jgi:hypothetical protein
VCSDRSAQDGTQTEVIAPGHRLERAFWLARCPDLIGDCTVLKLAHHGSRNGTDARWLKIVRPRLTVASMGRGNEFGHPHPETLALLERRAIPLLRTDPNGTVMIVGDGSRWWLPRHPEIVRGSPVGAERGGVAGLRRSSGGSQRTPAV